MPEGIVKAEPITKEHVRGFFNLWSYALSTGNSSKVTDCYANEAVLLPTISDTPRTTREQIEDYFDAFILRKPQGVITEGHVTIGVNWAQDAGAYEFTMGDDGSTVKARYSFIYVFEDGAWKISHHHSSVMPEELLAKKGAPLSLHAVLPSVNEAHPLSVQALLPPVKQAIPFSFRDLLPTYVGVTLGGAKTPKKKISPFLQETLGGAKTPKKKISPFLQD
jgi:uncharacterized protein (TIGR02246 family)